MKTQFIVVGGWVLEAPSDQNELPNHQRFDSFEEAVENARKYLLERIENHLSKMNLDDLYQAERALSGIVTQINFCHEN